MSSPATLATALTDILNGISTVIDSVAQAIAANASVIGELLVLGALAIAVVTVGRRVFSSVGRFFTGLMGGL
jgi:hypothetical protein